MTRERRSESVRTRGKPGKNMKRVVSRRLDNTFFLQRVGRCFALRNVDDTVHVEAYLLRVGGPVFVAEAVCVFPIHWSDEGMIAV